MATFDLEQLGETSGAWEALEAMVAVLKLWVPVAVVKVNAAGYSAPDGPLAQPKFFGRLNPSVISKVIDQVPAVMASSPGTTGKIDRIGTDGWAAWYVVNVTVVDRGQTFEDTSERVQIWAGLIRNVVLGNTTLRGRVSEVKWMGETFGPIPDDQGRTFAGCTVTFQVKLPVTAASELGTITPDPVYPDPTTGLPNPLPDTPVVVDFQLEKP